MSTEKKDFCSGIHVLIAHNDKYLVMKRSENDPNQPGHWDLPGGGVDHGEQPLEAAFREVKEEAGLDVTITKILNTFAFHDIEKGAWNINTTAMANTESNQVTLSNEHSECLWVSRSELTDLKPKSIHLESLNSALW